MMNPSVSLGLALGMVLLRTINFTGCEPKEILTVKKENVYVMDMKLVCFICSLVHILETAFGRTGAETVFLKC